jgi:hypothetical protein
VGGSCFEVISGITSSTCVAPYVQFGTSCKFANPNPLANPPTLAETSQCPAVPQAARVGAINGESHTTGSITKLSDCNYIPVTTTTSCTAAADLGLVNGECRRSVALTGASPQCSAPFSLVGQRCVRYSDTATAPASCPAGSSTDLDGQCRKPVADAAGTYGCPSGGTLNGKSCLVVTGFLVDASAVRYICDAGQRSAVTTATGTVRAICLLGPPTTQTGVSCPTGGILSNDGKLCSFAATRRVTAPQPAFTG